ncbi:MAG: phosphatidylserine/phosphatidylglycerophosphate/cardiolipin synthase family protein [Alphaproteobacteria bacterium]|nr:MAG: phosphatidylserine/phosphatidylglycerophosphate/cardiolipin synthase family protein [Alphaproteobacteria bacterium]
MTFESRRIFKSRATSQNLVRELLQMMLLGEIASPGGQRAWLVSPWISNVVLFDNRAGGFTSVNPEWSGREVRLIEVALHLMARGTSLGVATNFDDHNDPFLSAIKIGAEEVGLSDKLLIIQRENLHVKGILLKRGLLTGSMNLTYRGLELNDETVVYDTANRVIAQARVNFESYARSNS